MSAQENADEMINNQPPENDDHQSQDENSLPPTTNPGVQVSEALSGYVTRAEMQSYLTVLIQLSRSCRVTSCLRRLSTLHKAMECSFTNLRFHRLYSRTSMVGECNPVRQLLHPLSNLTKVIGSF